MEIEEPIGREMRWILRLRDFYFRIEFKKGFKNTQADSIFRRGTLWETTAEIDE